MTKNVTKIIMAVMLVMVVFTMVAPVYAIDPQEIASQIKTDGTAAEKTKEVSGQIIGLVQIVGTAIAVIMLVVLGIKYVIAAPSEKAEIKKSALIYVIAAIFLFAAVNILAVIQDFANDTFDT